MRKMGQAGTGVKGHFKSAEGRYTLSHEKSHPVISLHHINCKTVTKVTLAHLKEKPPTTPSNSSTSFATSSMKMVTQRLGLGTSNGTRALSFGGGNGAAKIAAGGKLSSSANAGSGLINGTAATSTYDGEGTYLIFNAGDGIFISDYTTHDKEPIKEIRFNSIYPLCHAFDSEARDGHDLLVGMNSGEVFSFSLRLQLQDPGKKPVSAMHYNKDGSINNSRCTAIAWVPLGDGHFVVAHADGNIYLYDKSKDGSGDASFPIVKDPTQFMVVHARSSKSNPLARWHIFQGSVNDIAFSVDGMYLSTVGRDGLLRIFDFKGEQLICGGKSYFGALLCCSWSPDGKYVLTGGEDDLVQVWSMEDRAVVARGEGHSSWVSGVAFDPFWAPPSSDDTGEAVTYRFGSVGQDAQLLLWDLSMDEVVMPLRRLAPSGSSPRMSNGSVQSGHWDTTVHPIGVLQPAPKRNDVPKIAPLVTHRVHLEPLSGLIFTKASLITVCHEGVAKIWARPSPDADTPPTTSDTSTTSATTKDKQAISNNKISATAHFNKQ